MFLLKHLGQTDEGLVSEPRQSFEAISASCSTCSSLVVSVSAAPPRGHCAQLRLRKRRRRRRKRRRRDTTEERVESASNGHRNERGALFTSRHMPADDGRSDLDVTMRGAGMDLLWRILAALSFDCFKDSSSSRSPTKQSSSQAGSLESSSLTGSLSLGPDLPHCQCCISYESRLKRLSCGHLYCDPCCDQIVNLAFEDIEGLSDYPCPMCKSIRQLGGLGPSCSGYFYGPYGILQQQQFTGKEHGSRWG